MAKKIIQYIIATVLALAILALIILNILSSTLLDKSYILSKLQEQNYYDKIYEDVNSNFENYIYQSGLDESVIDGIITKEKIKTDTKKIIDNIYSGMDEKIDTEEIKNKLNNNINESLNHNITETQKKAIDTFIETICKEYETTISHTSYEEKLNNRINIFNKYVGICKKIVLVVIGVSVILLVLLTIKRIYKITASFGISFVIDGLILLLANNYINSNIKIDTIMLLNTGISDVLKSISNEILENILKTGSILLALGIILTIIYGIIKSVRKAKREKEQYTPEI